MSSALGALTGERPLRTARVESNAAAYKPIASKYRKLKPKYMELYSRTPPTSAPIRFIDIALEILRSTERRVEKTIPEKNRGQVRMNTVPILPATVEGKPPARATHQPTKTLTINNK